MRFFGYIFLIFFTTSCQSITGYFSNWGDDYPEHYYEKEDGRMCQVSKEEVVILGGRNYEGTLKETFLLNLKTKSFFSFPVLKGKIILKIINKKRE